MNKELKPCPFCGQEAEVVWLSGIGWIARCTDHEGCKARMPGFIGNREAAEAWNRRSEPEERTSPATETAIGEILESMEITQGIASAICPHMWHSGNRHLANGECDRFICRYHLAKYNRSDETLMILPYTNLELIEALKRHCEYYFEEVSETCPGRLWNEPDKWRAAMCCRWEDARGVCRHPEQSRNEPDYVDYCVEGPCPHMETPEDCQEGDV